MLRQGHAVYQGGRACTGSTLTSCVPSPSQVGLDPGKILPTVGLNVGRLEASNQPMVFWDLGGQSGLRSIWAKYYSESHAVIYVVRDASRLIYQSVIHIVAGSCPQWSLISNLPIALLHLV